MTHRIALAAALLFPTLTLAQSGDTLGVHDPCIAFDHGTYYIYSTGRGLPIRSSPDLYTWHKAGRVFTAVPAWAKEKIPATTALWAPDLSYFSGQWHLYYAASSFGSDTSVIGLATNPTLDPHSPDYHWTDQGLVIQSQPHGGWNAIDPCLVLEDPDSRDATRRASRVPPTLPLLWLLLGRHPSHQTRPRHRQTRRGQTHPHPHRRPPRHQVPRHRGRLRLQARRLLLPLRLLRPLLQGDRLHLQHPRRPK